MLDPNKYDKLFTVCKNICTGYELVVLNFSVAWLKSHVQNTNELSRATKAAQNPNRAPAASEARQTPAKPG
jgi:hypothetical protein